MTLEKLQGMRKLIDCYDDTLVKLLAQRFKIVSDIGLLKSKLNLPPLDISRFNEIVQRTKELADTQKIDPRLIEDIFKVIHEHSLKLLSKYHIRI